MLMPAKCAPQLPRSFRWKGKGEQSETSFKGTAAGLLRRETAAICSPCSSASPLRRAYGARSSTSSSAASKSRSGGDPRIPAEARRRKTERRLRHTAWYRRQANKGPGLHSQASLASKAADSRECSHYRAQFTLHFALRRGRIGACRNVPLYRMFRSRGISQPDVSARLARSRNFCPQPCD